MPRSFRNTIANAGGLIVTAGLALVFMALYFRLLGSENYGLVGFCTTILLVGNLFVDLGLGRSVVRELARREHDPGLAQEMRDALFTLQTVHFGLALLCGLGLIASSGWIAANWLKHGAGNVQDATAAIAIVGLIAILQLPRELCRASLGGLQRQVFLNIWLSIFAALRGIVTLAALFFIEPTATVFLIAQLGVSAVETTAFVIAVWRHMPRGTRRVRFEPRIVKETWRFATSDGLAVLLGVGMLMGDRIVLSWILPLESYGAYMLAVMVTDVILRSASPFTQAYFPHLTDLVARSRQEELSVEYQRVAQFIASLVVPLAMLMCFFPTEIIALASGNAALASTFAGVLALRALGNMVNALQYLPHCLQLAQGKASVALVINMIGISIYLPAILLLTPHYGIMVPVSLWLVVNLSSFAPMIVITHRLALKRQGFNWVKDSVLMPLLAAVVVVAISRAIAPHDLSWAVVVPWLATTGVLATAAVIVASRRTREAVLNVLLGQAVRKQA